MAKKTNKELFVDGFARALKEQLHVDVLLRGGDGDEKGAYISAHKIVLSARSEVFQKILKSDDVKAKSNLEITLLELKHTELEALVEFIYSTGSSLSTQGRKHVRSLYLAANNYEIPHLRDLCRVQLINSLNSSNALSVLELAQIPFDKALNNAALATIRNNINTISSSDAFKDFAVNYPSLTVEIVKDYLRGSLCTACGRCCQFCNN